VSALHSATVLAAKPAGESRLAVIKVTKNFIVTFFIVIN